MEALGGEKKKNIGKPQKASGRISWSFYKKGGRGPAAVALAQWEGFGESKLRLDGGLSELSEDELITTYDGLERCAHNSKLFM